MEETTEQRRKRIQEGVAELARLKAERRAEASRRKPISELKVGDSIIRKTSTGRAYRAVVTAIQSYVSNNPAIFGQSLVRVYFSPVGIESKYYNSETIASFSGPLHLTVECISK